MAGFDGKAFGSEIVAVVKEYLAREIGDVAKRLDDIERHLASLPAPKDGRDADEDAVVSRVSEKMASEIENLRAAVGAIKIPEIPELPELPDVERMVAEAVSVAVKAIPAAKDGNDGLDVTNMFRAEGGKLIAVMSDGTTRDLGVFVGKDGRDADMAAIEKSIAEKVDAIPRPRDGKDGFSLKHFDADLMEDGRTVVLKFQDGSDTGYSVELGIPAMIYRGVFKEGQTYEKGDTVTWGGSLWHCDEARTVAKPDGAEKHWTLAAKKGRDGRDGETKAAREPAKVKV
ncbi:hypothetical protein [Shinella zoogloeoides]|uniref:hypothetical protein n=1 Tax=Shinella zoogloeoides TaxID=352475 RepID=UPI001F5AD1E0|nr:hypothetical protein [Shinella zoogloeoides]